MQYTEKKNSALKIENFIGKNLLTLTCLLKTLIAGTCRGSSNRYPQSMFWNKKEKETKVYPCKPQFCYIKVGFKGVYISWTCYPDAC